MFLGERKMSNNQKKPFCKSLKFWIIFAITLFVVNMLLSFVFHDKYSNVFTAFSGWVSGISTIALGGLALWQNKQYKTLADDYNDTLLMPELYTSTELFDIYASKPFFVKVKGILPNISEVEKKEFRVFLLKGPIVDLCVKNATIDNKIYLFDSSYKFTLKDESKPFTIQFELPKEITNSEHNILLSLEYENIYSTRYEKKICIMINSDNSIQSINMSPARRI